MSRSRSQARAEQRTREAIEAVPPAPASLSPEAARYWHEAVSSAPAGHFSRPDYPLLGVWCSAMAHLSAASERLETEPESAPAAASYAKLLTAVSGLSVRLRLCPSSRNPRKDTAAGDSYERDGGTSWDALRRDDYYGGG